MDRIILNHKGNHLSLGNLYSSYIVFSLLITGLLFQLTSAGPIACTLLFLTLALHSTLKATFNDQILSWPKEKPNLSSFLISLLLLAPTAIYLILTWNQEFPNMGDHEHHKNILFVFAYIGLGLLTLIGILYGLLKKFKNHQKQILYAFVLIGLVASFFIPKLYLFARYPASFYTLASPLSAVWQLFEIKNQLNSNRLGSFLLVVAWLWALRPVLVGRWPDLRIFLFSSLLFFNDDYVYYFTSAYLEVGSILFCLLALELLVDENKPKWLAVFVGSFASLFKETAIFVSFVVWLYQYRDKLHPRHWRESYLTGLTSTAPYFIFMFLRSKFDISRTYSTLNFSEAFAHDRIVEYISRWTDHIGASGLVIILALAIVVVASFFSKKSKSMVTLYLMGLISFLSFEVMLILDKVAYDFSGYPRFRLTSFLLLLTPLLFVKIRNKVLLYGLAFLISTSQLYQSYDHFKLLSKPDYYRTGAEHYAMPTYYPIRKLMEEVKRTTPALATPTILMHELPNREFMWAHPMSSYPDLFKNTRIEIQPKMICACMKGYHYTFALFGYPSVLRKARRASDIKTNAPESCLESLRQTCKHVITETADDGYIVGIVGISN